MDWGAAERAELEALMREQLVLVSWDCREVRVLADCRLDGQYGYVGFDAQEDVIRMSQASEVALNLPLLGATLGGELRSGATVDVALIVRGKRRATRRAAHRGELGGACEGATHFVRGVQVGAFAVAESRSAAATTTAGIFGLGASGAHDASTHVHRSAGRRDACLAGDDTTPVSGCASALRLEMYALTAGDAATDRADVEAASCPPGWGFREGACRADAGPHECDPANPSECRAQCTAGDARSCAHLGFLLQYRSAEASGTLTEAAAVYARACDAQVAAGCAGLGVLTWAGTGGLARDPTRARALQQRACDAGDARGCANLGAFVSVDGDEAGARALYARSCAGGFANACGTLALLDAPTASTPEARSGITARLEQACRDGTGDYCIDLARWLTSGSAPGREGEAAAVAEQGLTRLLAACERGDPGRCTRAARALELGQGVERKPERAAELYRRACSLDDASGCLGLASMVEQGLTTGGDAAALRQRACAGGLTAGCADAADGGAPGGAPPGVRCTPSDPLCDPSAPAPAPAPPARSGDRPARCNPADPICY